MLHNFLSGNLSTINESNFEIELPCTGLWDHDGDGGDGKTAPIPRQWTTVMKCNDSYWGCSDPTRLTENRCVGVWDHDGDGLMGGSRPIAREWKLFGSQTREQCVGSFDNDGDGGREGTPPVARVLEDVWGCTKPHPHAFTFTPTTQEQCIGTWDDDSNPTTPEVDALWVVTGKKCNDPNVSEEAACVGWYDDDLDGGSPGAYWPESALIH
jgi:hypothetical protein